MALLTEVVTATLFDQQKETADEILAHHPLTALLKAKGQVNVRPLGREIRKVVLYNDTALGSSYSGYDTFSLVAAPDMDAFQFDVKQIWEMFTISGREKRGNNSSKHELVDLIDQKFKACKGRLKNQMEEQILGDGTGNGAKDWDGISNAVSTTVSSGTYGGIDRATYTWARNVGDNTTLTLANVQSTVSSNITQISRNSEGPDCALAGRTAWGFLHDSLTAIQRINDETTTAKAGARSLVFDGVKFFFDGGFNAGNSGAGTVGTNTVRLLNTNYITLDIEKQANFMPLADMDRPTNQDAFFTVLICEGNLCCSAPNLQAVIYP